MRLLSLFDGVGTARVAIADILGRTGLLCRPAPAVSGTATDRNGPHVREPGSKSVHQIILLLTVGRLAQELLSDQIQNSFR